MSSNNERLIAVIGASGQQGGAVVGALQAGRQFKVRALTAIQASIANSPTKSSKQIWTAPKPSKLHFKGHMAYFSSRISGKKAPTSSSRQKERTGTHTRHRTYATI
jgi:hypothetical protein